MKAIIITLILIITVVLALSIKPLLKAKETKQYGDLKTLVNYLLVAMCLFMVLVFILI